MNYFNYFTEIEEEFVKRRGSHLLISPLDWSLMEMWKQRGVPLNIVLRGINTSFDSYDQRVYRGRKVNSLFYCQQEVEAMFLEYCELRVGSGGEGQGDAGEPPNGRKKIDEPSKERYPFTAAAIINYLSEHSKSLEQLSEKHSSDAILSETFARTGVRLDQIIEDLQTAKNISPEGVETDLTMIEEVILDGLKERAGEELLGELRREGNNHLRSYKQKMEQEIYRQTLDNFIARRLRERYHVPRLSLFYL
jgi:hypothetical protein